MTLEIAAFALVMTAVAGYFDLRTTEVPDEIPALLISGSLFYWYVMWGTTGNALPLLISIVSGTLLLGIGLLLYYKGQWGGADAWILAGIAYALPVVGGSLFIVDYLFTFFLVTIVYMIAYALALGAMHRKVFSLFAADLRKSWHLVAGIPLAYAIFVVVVAFAGLFRPSLLWVLALVVLITVFWRYARVIEKNVFRRRISASKLRAGDVPADSIWVGLSKKQIANMRKKRRTVVIKEGVRFVPAFPIALLLTLIWGNVFFLLL